MNEDGKILGMTRQQIGILGGLAGALIVLVCIGGFLVIRGGGLIFSGQSAPTAVPTVTSIIATPVTPIPTITPTPIPYEQLIPADWNQFKTSLVEIWMPGNFRLGNETLTNLAEGGSRVPELVITEIPSNTSLFNMIVTVSYIPLVGDSLDKFLETHLPEFPYQAQLVDRQTVYINTVEARRFVYEIKVNNIDLNMLLYVLLDGSTVWYIQYVAEIVEYFDYLPVFEQSIQTFRIVR